MNWTVEPFHVWYDAMLRPLEPTPEPSTPWTVQKQMNRLAKRVAQVEAGKWLPRVEHKLNGSALKELRAAQELLGEARLAIQGG